MSGFEEHTLEIGGIETWVRHKPGRGTPVVFWHGNPTDADDWLGFMAQTDAPCWAPDLPGFGRSGRPDPALFSYSMEAYGDWATALLEALGLVRYDAVVHDWGAIGLLAAQRHPERLRRLAGLNFVPFGVGYRWHWIARLFWRRRVLGEAFNSLAGGPAAGLVLRQARPGWRAMPAEFLERFERAWRDPVTRDAVLRLYRSAGPAELEAAGRGMAALDAPALLTWARRDPYIPAEYGRRLARLLPRAELVEIEGAGHWPWLDRPDLPGTVMRFLAAG